MWLVVGRTRGKMKIVLSRKGFDTTNDEKSNCGGVASAIFPDGTMLSLPIPEVSQYMRTGIRYSDIECPTPDFENLGILVEQLSRGPLRPTRDSFAHLDPDLNRNSLRWRAEGWKPLFGQDLGAQTELASLREGDLFLFVGRFQEIEIQQQRGVKVARFRRGSIAKNMIFGWLSIGKVLRVGTSAAETWLQSNRWAAY
ncbi:MAG TPA: hypothetical protein VFO86_09375, partial [Terriglobia bacterium]|nr:hypothetical protein [Terriglobia bacterium]